MVDSVKYAFSTRYALRTDRHWKLFDENLSRIDRQGFYEHEGIDKTEKAKAKFGFLFFCFTHSLRTGHGISRLHCRNVVDDKTISKLQTGAYRKSILWSFIHGASWLLKIADTRCLHPENANSKISLLFRKEIRWDNFCLRVSLDWPVVQCRRSIYLRIRAFQIALHREHIITTISHVAKLVIGRKRGLKSTHFPSCLVFFGTELDVFKCLT